MTAISTEIIGEAVYNLCLLANTSLNFEIYEKIKNSELSENILNSILENAKIAYTKKLPLCQDTGQVIVFVEIGQDVRLEGKFLNDAINEAVEKCYRENFFRKSVVRDAIFDRKNTETNLPAIIYTKITEEEIVNIKILIKGGGSENKSLTKMLLPTLSEEEIISEISNMIISAGVNACPPMFVGICAGGTMDKAAILSKEVFFENDFSENEKNLAQKIKDSVNLNAPQEFNQTSHSGISLHEHQNSYVLDIKLRSVPTHIACLPVAVTINCHSDRYSSCSIKDKKITYNHKMPEFINTNMKEINIKEIKTDDIEEIRALNIGERILLTGEIFVARDMAHKKLKEMVDKGIELPIEIKDKIIFYAGPCPAKPDEVIGSIGPTTAGRMDKYAETMYNMGLLATIGKGSRSKSVRNVIIKNRAKYFTITGGIAALLAEKVKKCEVIAFDELGAEALYKLYVEKFPLKVEI